jgi:hypothetical protein
MDKGTAKTFSRMGAGAWDRMTLHGVDSAAGHSWDTAAMYA